MANNTNNDFLDYLQKKHKNYILKKELIHHDHIKGSIFDIQQLDLLIQEYNQIINEYKKYVPNVATIDFNKIRNCNDCPQCVIYDAELQKAFCSTMKGKTITQPEQIPKWCPLTPEKG